MTVARINSFIATLATSFIIFGIGYIVSDRAILRPHDHGCLRRARTDRPPGPHVRHVGRRRWWSRWPGSCWPRTRFGRYVYAVGGNVEAARLTGVRVRWVVAITFVLSGLAAAPGRHAALLAQHLRATPSDDLSFVFSVIAAIVVGGTSIAGGEGTIWRTILGAFFIAFMVNGFNLHQVDPIFQRIVLGHRDPGRGGHRCLVPAPVAADPSRSHPTNRRRIRP